MSCRPEQLPDASAKSLAPYLPIEDVAVRASFILSVLLPVIGYSIIRWGRAGTIGQEDGIVVFFALLMVIGIPVSGLSFFVVHCNNAPEEIRGVRKWLKAFWQRNVIGRTLIMDMYEGKPRYFIDGDARTNPHLPGGAPRADVDIFNVPFSVIVNLARPRLQSRMVCGAWHGYMHIIRVQCVKLSEGGVTLQLADSIGNSLQFPDKTALMALAASGIGCLDLWVAYMMHGNKDLEAKLGDVKRERDAYKETIRIAMEAIDESRRFVKSKHGGAIRMWLLHRIVSISTSTTEGMRDWPDVIPKPERAVPQTMNGPELTRHS